MNNSKNTTQRTRIKSAILVASTNFKKYIQQDKLEQKSVAWRPNMKTSQVFW